MSAACNGTAYHNGNPMMTDEQKLALRQFNYCKQLSKVMMEVVFSDVINLSTCITIFYILRRA